MGLWDDIKNLMRGSTSSEISASVTASPETADMAKNGTIGNMQQERRPVIGISGMGGESKSVAAIVTQIRASGAEPVLISEHVNRIAQYGGAEQAAKHDLAKMDALIVMGNNDDIDPAKYGQTAGANTKVETNTGRASYEEAAISQALDSKLPLLGICGGMQRLNVLDGGTLNQHIPDILGGDNYHNQGSEIAPFVPVQVVHIAHGGKLAEIAGSRKSVYVPQPGASLPDEIVLENSFHHQAVDKVGADFKVAAVSDEDRVKGGIVQAIEPKADGKYAGQFVLGVQWHPEFGASDLGPKIASSITDAARQHALTRAPEKETVPEALPEQPGENAQRILAQRAQQALLNQQRLVMAR